MIALAAPLGRRAVHRINPVTKLAACAVISVALVLSIDWTSASVALGLEALLLPLGGLTPAQFSRRTAVVWLAAALGGFTILLYGRPSGERYLQFFLIQVTDGSIELAVATALRALAMAIPAIVLFATVDPTDLADGLAQVCRLPARFVLGALAGLRLLALFSQDWHSLERARRTRGIAKGAGVIRFFGQAFAILVLSLRRGSKLATAMEARAFDSSAERSWARPSVFGFRDAVLLGLSVVIAASAVTVAVLTGQWNFIGGQ